LWLVGDGGDSVGVGLLSADCCVDPLAGIVDAAVVDPCG
jgi:hypothetical protein